MNTTAIRALARARELVLSGEAPAVLVGAADSLVSPRRLLELSRADRLLTEDNADGVIPGEAAACVLVARQGGGALGRIGGIGFGQEPASLDNDVPLRADGLVAASRAALSEASAALQDMQVRVSDAAGEGYAFREQALTVGRLLRVNMERFPLDLPARALGDTGCAASLCGIVLGLPRVVPSGAGVPRHIIAYSSGAAGERAAVVLERLERSEHG
jgi:3-oxoacyl-[acyl-carrier-protein] synthase-1